MLKYKLDDYKDKLICNNYILQIVSGRKLSNIYHCHDFYEVFVILEGSAVHFVNGTTQKMSKGNFTILFPEDAHKFISQSKDLKLLGISVSVSEFKTLSLAYDSKNKLKREYTYFCEDKICELLNNLPMTYGFKDLFIQCKLFLSIVFSIVYSDCNVLEKSIPQDIEYIVTQMKKEENIKYNIEYFSKLSNYSYPHYYRLMKEHYNKTPLEFLLDIKMENAYSKVMFSNMNLDVIAESIGFNSVSHFHSIFKKHFNITPGNLRKNHKNIKTL